MARQQLTGPTLVLFVDTIVDEDMSFLFAADAPEAVIWVKQVQDPRRFGELVSGLMTRRSEEPH